MLTSPFSNSDTASKPDSTEYIVSAFSEDDKSDKIDKADEDDKPVKKSKGGKAESDESDESDDEIEIKGDKPEEEEDKIDLSDDKDVEIDAPPKKREILKKYPKIFEEFPYLEKVIYRDKQYQELYGSFDDAVEAHGKAEALDKFEGQIMSGSTEDLFKSVKESDPKAFAKLAGNLLTNLSKVDKEAYLGVVSDVVQQVIVHMVSEGKNLENTDLQKAALLVNQFVFGTSDFKANKREEPERDNELENERQTFRAERYSTAVNDVQLKVGNMLKNTISEYIDPKEQMSSFVKKNAIREALEFVDSTIAKDSNFRKQLDRLWVDAEKNKFSKASIDKIRSAFLGKAKGILPSAIKKSRAEALKDMNPVRKEDSDDESEKKDRKGPISPGRSTPHNSGKPELKKGESPLDFMMRD